MNPYYQDDLVTIYNCDWREVLPIEADLVLTDPPYGIGAVDPDGTVGGGTRISIKWESGKAVRSKSRGLVKYRHVDNDHSPDEARECVSALTQVPKQIWWGANHYGDTLGAASCWLVWDKQNGTTDFADGELAWTNLDGAVRFFRHKWHGMFRDSEKAIHYHPTQKPVALMDWCIARAKLKPNSLIFDPFMGSGPVAVAAKRAGHRYVGCELVEKYCEIAAKRCGQDYLFGEAG